MARREAGLPVVRSLDLPRYAESLLMSSSSKPGSLLTQPLGLNFASQAHITIARKGLAHPYPHRRSGRLKVTPGVVSKSGRVFSVAESRSSCWIKWDRP
jgi:hypothetical protein